MILLPIGKQLRNEWRQNIWLLLELVVVALFLLVAVDYMWNLRKNYTDPTGFDVTDTYQLNIKRLTAGAGGYLPKEAAAEVETDDVSLDRLAAAVRLHPDVEQAALSTYASPFARGGWWTMVYSDTLHMINIQRFIIQPEYLEVFRILSHDGQPLRLPPSDSHRLILSGTALEKGGYASAAEAVGDTLTVQFEDNLVIPIAAVCQPLKSMPYVPYSPSFLDLVTREEWNAQVRARGGESCQLWARIRPGRSPHFEKAFREEMGTRLRSGQLYVSSLWSGEREVGKQVDEKLQGEVIPILYVMGFVLLTAFLGVFGAFWLRTRQRRGEIGLRMAMGASRGTIAVSYIVEAFWLMILAMVPAFVIYLNLLYAEVLDVHNLAFTAGRVGLAVAVSACILGGMVVLGVSIPARGALGIYPAEALRDE